MEESKEHKKIYLYVRSEEKLGRNSDFIRIERKIYDETQLNNKETLQQFGTRIVEDLNKTQEKKVHWKFLHVAWEDEEDPLKRLFFEAGI